MDAILEYLPSQEILRLNMNNVEKLQKRTRKKLVKVEVEKEEIKEFKCRVCKKIFKDKSYLNTHSKTHLKVCKFECDLCEYKGKTSKYLSRHKKKCHSEPTANECDFCGKKFHFKSSLVKHTLVHTGEKPYKCEICGKAFNTTYSLNTHILIHTDQKPFECSYCEYACRDSSTLRKHQARHLGNEKVYKCRMCDQSYKDKYKLKKHVASKHLDVDVKKYTCDQCGKLFQWKATLNTHIQAIHERSLTCKCKICGSRLTNRANLKSHMRRHVDVKPYRCTQEGCGKAFKTTSELRKHVIIHRPEEQYPCATCGRMFTRRHRRDRHEAANCQKISKTVYECHHCGYNFRSKRLLSNHMSSRHGVMKKMYKCDLCGVTSYSERNMLNHINYGHGNENEKRCKICKAYFQKNYSLKKHYVKRHDIIMHLETASKKRTEENLQIKEEPIECEDLMDLLEVEKHEIIDDGATFEGILDESGHVVYNKEISQNIDSKAKDSDVNDEDIDDLGTNINQNRNIETDVGIFPKRNMCIDDILNNTVIYTTSITENVYKNSVFNENLVIGTRNTAVTNQNITNVVMNESINEYTEIDKNIETDANIKAKRNENVDITGVNTLVNTAIDRNIDIAGHIEISNKIINSAEFVHTNIQIDDNQVTSKNSINVGKKRTNLNTDSNVRDKNKEPDVNLDSDENISRKEKDIINENIGVKKLDSVDYIPTSKENYEDESEFKNLAKETIEINRGNLKNVPERMFDEFFIEHTLKKHMVKKDKKVKRNYINVKAEQYVKKYLNGLLYGSEEGACSVRNKPRYLKRVENDDIRVKEKKNETVNGANINEKQKGGGKKYGLKLKMNSHQCYVCFKLFPTKDGLLKHCQEHFDVCTESMLIKCPHCQYVTKSDIKRHMRVKHGLELNIPFSRIKENRDVNGSTRYCFEVDGTVLEVIPSVKNLNKIESKKIDEKAKKKKENFIGKAKLVRKGDEWFVEKVKVDRREYMIPRGIVYDNNVEYLEKMREFSKKAKEEGKKMLFPCNACEKKCQTLSALKLHFRKHEENPKPFKKKRWKHKREETVREDRIIALNRNRLQAPKPIVNKHKCDKKLMDFYRKNIKGGDVEFWQFLKIYNKMSRENIKDFEDIEIRTDFGIHFKAQPKKDVAKAKVVNRVRKRVKVLTRKEHLRREKKRIELRKKVAEGC